MEPSFRLLRVDKEGDVLLVHIRQLQMLETDVLDLGAELTSLITNTDCKQMVLWLGPEIIDCLYSVLLAKLATVRRKLHDKGGKLVLCEVPDVVQGVFEVCHLKSFFTFAASKEAALAALTAP